MDVARPHRPWTLPGAARKGICLRFSALGASDARLIFLRILPNSIGPLLVSGTLQMAYAIITELGLSYLGFGIQPPTPSWGNILESAQIHVYRAPWLAVFPGLMIFITVIAINFVGDGLRDAFDPVCNSYGKIVAQVDNLRYTKGEEKMKLKVIDFVHRAGTCAQRLWWCRAASHRTRGRHRTCRC